MGGKTDIVKGQIEEAAGVLVDNNNIRNKGKSDQLVGKIKKEACKATEQAKKRMRG
jgi:uncharacterized protein YjbJ (UPF0337 family)